MVFYLFLKTRAKSRKMMVKIHRGWMRNPKTNVAVPKRTQILVKQPKTGYALS
jgi:hypothetical protein